MNAKHIQIISRCVADLNAIVVEIRRGTILANSTVRDLSEAMADSQAGVPMTVLPPVQEVA